MHCLAISISTFSNEPASLKLSGSGASNHRRKLIALNFLRYEPNTRALGPVGSDNSLEIETQMLVNCCSSEKSTSMGKSYNWSRNTRNCIAVSSNWCEHEQVRQRLSRTVNNKPTILSVYFGQVSINSNWILSSFKSSYISELSAPILTQQLQNFYGL